ncbi:MAG: PQQ-dependent sugar dehydrogenase, partial [Ferruginibacter sp.]|nr:PQQ-dependent sugar dehydrogenase [Cytophagales bacterium]
MQTFNAAVLRQCARYCLLNGRRASIFAGILLFWSQLSFTQSFPQYFSQVQVTNGISSPTVMAFAPDGRIFVAEQGGKLRVIKNNALLAAPFVQLSVNSQGERGLIGIALDPGFATNGYVYLYYTVANGTLHNRISRFTANGDVAVAGSERVVLDLDALSSATNHNGGAMHFGKDGKLYVAVGENANASYAQNLDVYHGKLLRINADGSVPAGNPYASGSEQKKRVWAYGLRNPYTFAVQPGTGRILVNDVGQNNWEEINDATAGNRNFGWPAAEGTSGNAAYANPVYAYPHGDGDGRGCAITGGTFFNPTATNYPAGFTGKYFYQDLCNRWINVVDVSGGSAVRTPFATGLPGSTLSISTGNDGNLYYLSRDNGALYKIIYSSNTAPAITGQPTSVSTSQGQPASFTVGASGTAPLSYQWRKNGVNIAGATSTAYTIASTVPANAGQYRVVVSNAAGSATSNVATLAVAAFNAPPVATITSPADHKIYRAGDVISFTGTGTDPDGGTLPASAFSWVVNFHHDSHKHDGPPVVSGAKSGSFEIPTEGETSANVWYRLILTVTDSQGLTHRDSVDLDPKVVAVSLASNPSGLQLNLGGQPQTTPYTQNFVSGILLSLGAPPSQTLNNVTYAFNNWTAGAGAGGSITVPDVNTTYTANFTANAALLDPVGVSNPVSGLQYAYYEGTWDALPDFNALTPGETGEVNQFDLSPRNRNDNFGFRYTGYVSVAADGQYTFYTSSDDGSQLFVGTTLVVNNNGLHGVQERSGTVGLKAGLHPITVTHFEKGGQEVLAVSYAGPGVGKQVIPATALYYASSPGLRPADNPAGVANGLQYGYYEGSWSFLPDFAALTPKETGTATAIDLSPRKRNENFALQFTGYVSVPTDGLYTFFTNSDDGSQLFIGSTLVVENNGLHGVQERSGSIGLKAGRHALRVGYLQGVLDAVLSVSYAGPGIGKQAIPASALYTRGLSLRSADNPGGSSPGLNYGYYEGSWSFLPDFAALTPKETGTATAIDLSLRNRNEEFALQFTGYVSVPTDGLYTFFTNSDDGSQLFIGSTLVV